MKTLQQLFSKFEPDRLSAEFFADAGEYTVTRAKGSADRFEIVVHPSRLWEKEKIYAVEDGLREAYDGKYIVRFVTKYPSFFFSAAYCREIITDAVRTGLAAPGFFDNCTVSLEGYKLTIGIPFGQGGVDFLEIGRTSNSISSLIFVEFGLNVETLITEKNNYLPYSQSEDVKSFYEELDRKCREELERYESYIETGEKAETAAAAKPEEKQLNLKHIRSAFDENAAAVTADGICKIGPAEFNIVTDSFFYGEPFAIEPVSVASLTGSKKDCVIIGTLSNVLADTRNKQVWYVTAGLFDGNATMMIKFPQCDEDTSKELVGTFKNGSDLACLGDIRKDIKSGDLYISPKSFAKIKRIPRTDRATEKRVELHLHTSMSAMDAITTPETAIKTAMSWGYKAIAITDHGNVQAFPDVMLALDKKYEDRSIPKEEQVPEEKRFKPIYGMEAYFVNDMASPLTGDYAYDFDAPCVVFDLETTGLSSSNCAIIEIGAVKLENGKICDRFSSFVDPGVHIPAEITKITSITDDDVKGAPAIDKILPEFLDFCGSSLLVAHNADFDTGFIRAAANAQNIPFELPYLDTVALSRYLNPELGKHTLDAVAGYFGLGDFNHHRAVDDAEMLARIYLCMIEKMRSMDIKDYPSISEEISGNSDPLKLRSHHMIILVQTQAGLKNLYRLISESYLKYYFRNPRIPKTLLDKYREGLIIGSACSAGELYEAILDNRPENEIEEIASYYDYLEIQPASNDNYLIEEGKVADVEALHAISKRIVELGDKLGKPVCATSDSHFIDPQDELYRRILLAGMKFRDFDKPTPIYLHTTEEMLEEFSYLGADKAYEVVIKNTNMIADMIGRVRPIPKGSFPPHLDGADEELSEKCWSRARKLYGDNLPEIVSNRLNTELTSIIKNGFAVLYVIAERLVHYSESQGYLVGSRGSVGSSFVAAMGGISEVNALPPHYYCPKCRFSDFTNEADAGSGFDMPTKYCPVCGEKLMMDGQDIPFETFLGFKGEKSPDIDLNFSGEVQGRVHKFTEELFGAENVFKAGTMATLADKTAYGFVMKYYENKGLMLPRAEIDRIIGRCMGVKRTTGQHPGGIIVVPREMDVYDFTPVQHPADDPKSDIVTTHFAFSYLHDTILKLDELGHDIPTKYKYLERYSGIDVMDVEMNDKSVYEIFDSTDSLGIPQMDREDKMTRMLGLSVGTLGLPEFGTSFIQQVLLDAKPKNFADLMQISGLTHGTDVWLGNAQDLIKAGTCDISHVVGTRDGIMLDLIKFGVEKSMSFKIMEKVRKNKKGEKLPEDMMEAMHAANVPEWYIGSLQKIKYMFPKAHAAAYVMSAIRLAWYKVHQPLAFYCAILSVAPDGFVGEVVVNGRGAVVAELQRIDKLGKEATQKEIKSISALQLADEALLRGIKFLPVSLKKSAAKDFIPENGNIRMPFTALSGVGENAALSIVEAREAEPFFSVEDLRERGKANKGVVDVLRANGALEGLNETDQLSMFDTIL